MGVCSTLVLVLPLCWGGKPGREWWKKRDSWGNPKLGHGHVLEAGGECQFPNWGVFGCTLPAWQERAARPQLSRTDLSCSCFCFLAAAEASTRLWWPSWGRLPLCCRSPWGRRSLTVGPVVWGGQEEVKRFLLWDRACNSSLSGSPPSLHSPAIHPRFLTRWDEPQIFLQSPNSPPLSALWLLSVYCYHALLYITHDSCLLQGAFSEVKLNAWQNLQKQSLENTIALSWLLMSLFK